MPLALRSVLAACLTTIVLRVGPLTAQRVTTPEQHFGFAIGADYHLATYTQFAAYWRTLDRESPRMVVEEIGRTAEGRPQLMAIVTAPENHRNLARYREIAQRLGRAEGLSDAQAQALADEGKAVVWIDGGLHATEVLGAHQLIETSYRMVTGEDEETLRILDDVIILFVHANPDGMELVSDWYMREPVPEQRRTSGIPRLYHKYIGHDNNRDSYLVSQPETENMARILYIDWIPQIMYNHHQTGPAGTIMFAPPFRYPANYNIDPLVLLGIESVGLAMQSRFVYEGKPGVTMRNGGPFSTWWNGGLRTTAYFHNIIGLLTETQGNPTPVQIALIPDRQLPNGDNPLPIEPQTWHFRQSVEYSVTANRAVLDYASRHREQLLMTMYRAGRNAIERGDRDSWTLWPKRLAALEARLERDSVAVDSEGPAAGALAGYFSRGVPIEYLAELRRPEDRDPRGYILSADQPDFPTATKFVNTLIKNGVVVHRATRSFQVGGKSYPQHSYVVKAAQAFRPHILDMFEPQDHPNDSKYEGGPPTPPYDNAGYTLAYQMGVQFDRILEGFDGPFEPIEGLAVTPPGTLANANGASGYLISHAVNDAAVVTNRLLAAGERVYWLDDAFSSNGKTYPKGTIYVPAGPATRERLSGFASELGVHIEGTRAAPGGAALELQPIRIGLWDRYGGSMPSGWMRWLFEQFEFPFEVVYPQTLDQGNLRQRFDVLIFATDAVPESDAAEGDDDPFGGVPDTASIPARYHAWLGRISVANTVPHLMRFMEEGGTIITIGTSTVMAQHAGLPLSNHLVDGRGKPYGVEEFYIPGSVVRVHVDNQQPLAYGMQSYVDVFFDNSPVYRMLPEASRRGVRPVAWFDSARPLRSGWAWGEHHLEDGLVIAEAKVGQGNLFLFGPEITNRGQPHGTFKFLFNGIYLSGARERQLDLTN